MLSRYRVLASLDFIDPVKPGPRQSVVAARNPVAATEGLIASAVVGWSGRNRTANALPVCLPGMQGGFDFGGQARANVVNRDHVRVAEPRRGTGLPQHALPEDGTLRLGDVEGRRDLLDRYLTVEQLVGGQPHRAHAAAAELPEQPVPPGDDPAGLRRHSH